MKGKGKWEVGIPNVIGLLKSAIGDCVDELPHARIRMKLWDAVGMLYRVERQAKKRKS